MLDVVVSCVKDFHDGEYALLPLGSGQSLLFLFSPYTPFIYPNGVARIDAYYIKSSAIYHQSRQMIAALNNAGVKACLYKERGIKILAQKCGGEFGKNNLLFLEAYGSFFFITAVLLDGDFEKKLQPPVMPCAGCGKCIDACPTNALSDNGFCREKCIRHWHDRPHEMPEYIRSVNGLRLIGCNTCQIVCPVNTKQRTQPPEKLLQLLQVETLKKHSDEKPYLEEIGNFIGPNYIGKNRISGMAEIIKEGKKLC